MSNDTVQVPLDGLTRVGDGLRRPEYVLTTASGDLFVPSLGSGIVHLAADGTEKARYGDIDTVEGQVWVPNGMVLKEDGSFLISNMGQGGGIWRLDREGGLQPFLRRVDGLDLPATNFILDDGQGRLWVTVTTRHWPISRAFCGYDGPYVEDGFIVLIDARGARIVADGLAFANELRLDMQRRHLYVVETQGRRVTRFDIGQDGVLSERFVHTKFDLGTFPDGLAFDEEDHLWVAGLVSNQLWRVAPDGSRQLMLADDSPEHTAYIEHGMAEGSVTREDMQRSPGKVLSNIASIAFGGPDLRTVYLGSLGGSSLHAFRTPVAGRPLAHFYKH